MLKYRKIVITSYNAFKQAKCWHLAWKIIRNKHSRIWSLIPFSAVGFVLQFAYFTLIGHSMRYETVFPIPLTIHTFSQVLLPESACHNLIIASLGVILMCISRTELCFSSNYNYVLVLSYNSLYTYGFQQKMAKIMNDNSIFSFVCEISN